jgi:hypothetical protein
MKSGNIKIKNELKEKIEIISKKLEKIYSNLEIT